jgi:hypothetical protein
MFAGCSSGGAVRKRNGVGVAVRPGDPSAEPVDHHGRVPAEPGGHQDAEPAGGEPERHRSGFAPVRADAAAAEGVRQRRELGAQVCRVLPRGAAQLHWRGPAAAPPRWSHRQQAQAAQPVHKARQARSNGQSASVKHNALDLVAGVSKKYACSVVEVNFFTLCRVFNFCVRPAN